MSQNHQILNNIAGRVKEVVNAETAVVALAESEGEIVHYAAAVGKHTEGILVDTLRPIRAKILRSTTQLA